jgi:hypothetical protein
LYDNKELIVGDEAGRLSTIKFKFQGGKISGFNKHTEYLGLAGKVKSVAITHDHDILAVTSEGKPCCKIYDVKNGKFIRNLTFSESHGGPNLDMEVVIFSLNRKYLYTLSVN